MNTHVHCNFYWFSRLLFTGYIHRESWALHIPTSNLTYQIECRAFVNDSVLVPCCNASTYTNVCQPETGFARVVLDVVNSTPGSSAALMCAPGAELDHHLPIDDDCPTDTTARYCQIQTQVLSPPPPQEGNPLIIKYQIYSYIVNTVWVYSVLVFLYQWLPRWLGNLWTHSRNIETQWIQIF